MNNNTPVELNLMTWLQSLQRASAAVLALCVLVHLAVMTYAVHGGLTAGEILDRTQGSWGFLAFYAVFVLACMVHVPIGLMRVVQDLFGWSGRGLLYACLVLALALGVVGMRAALVMFV